MAATVREVLYKYKNARKAYESFMAMGSNPEQARNAVALLLWLEQTTSVLAISLLEDLNPHAVGFLAAEANSILDYLRAEPDEQMLALPQIPLISSLSSDGYINPRFFICYQDLVVRGVADILDGLGALIFDDRLHLLMTRFQTGLVGRFPELEAPYVCQPVTVPEDCRSMFITFSRGQPIEREEIFEYFRQKWGDCIVRVLMEKTSGGAQPMYGRIIFMSEAFVGLVLHGQQLVKVTINNRQIWLRKYVPRPQTNQS